MQKFFLNILCMSFMTLYKMNKVNELTIGCMVFFSKIMFYHKQTLTNGAKNVKSKPITYSLSSSSS